MHRFFIPCALAAGLLAGAVQAEPLISSYRFDGNCQDCANAAGTDTYAVTATLELAGAVAGQPATAAQFHRFSYGGSNLLAPFVVTRLGGGGDLEFDPLDDTHSFHADFLAGLPGFADVDLAVTLGELFAFFNTAADGTWTVFRTLPEVADDFGVQGTWSAVPAPATLALALPALGLLLGLSRTRARLIRTARADRPRR